MCLILGCRGESTGSLLCGISSSLTGPRGEASTDEEPSKFDLFNQWKNCTELQAAAVPFSKALLSFR